MPLQDRAVEAGASIPADLPLRDYAALRAALSVEGEDNAEVLRRFGLTVAAKQALQETYFDRFRLKPALRAQFEALLRDELRKRHRRGGGG